MTRILITGADGFVGTHLGPCLRALGHDVRAAVRSARASVAGSTDVRVVGDLEALPDWSVVLEGVQAVIHLAGRAHVTRETAADPATAFRRANLAPTLDLFRACQRAGVGRMVFVSSIGVLGTHSAGHPFTESDVPRPEEPYALSKLEAEQGLAALAGGAATQLVVVRPTLVCGAGARGNFDRLLRLVRSGVPLPFGSLRAERSFVGVRNLCDLLARCAVHPQAAGEIFLAADPEVLTLHQLLETLGQAIGVKTRIFPCPYGLLRLLGRLTGREAEIRRLAEPLRVDAGLARRILGWRNEVPLRDELSVMARGESTPG